MSIHEAIQAAWDDLEGTQRRDMPTEYQEAAAEHLFSLMALRQSAYIHVEAEMEAVRPLIEEVSRIFREMAEGLAEVAGSILADFRKLLKGAGGTYPKCDCPSQLTRVQARVKSMPSGVRARQVGFGNPPTIRR